MNSLDKFKDDYPEVFEKFLEMNRALASLQRAMVGAGVNGPNPHRPDNAPEPPTFDASQHDEPGLFLELD